MRPSGTLAWLALCWPLALAAGGVERIHTSGFGAHACGNGVVEEAEQCDDGDADEGDGCTTSCRVGAACDAAAFPGADRFAVDPASGHCYAAHEDEALPFDAASAACTARGAHLASLATASEDSLLRSLQVAGQRPWIGAADLAESGEYGWLTGEPWVHQRFLAGEPDADGRCLALGNDGGDWIDTDCSVPGPVTGWWCEREP